MDYEQTLLFFTVIRIIGVILYKSKYFLKIFSDLPSAASPGSCPCPNLDLGTSAIYTEGRAPNLDC